MTLNVSVIIVTYNSRRVVGQCLASLQQHLDGDAYEVIVVDNASPDGTADFVASSHPRTKLVRRPSNDGLSAAINDGVAASHGRFVMQLNPDVRVEGDVMAPLARYLDEHADVGVVAPKLLNDDGSLQLSCRAFPGYATALFNRYSVLTQVLPGNRFSRDYLMSDFDHAERRDVDWVSGAALMFPRTVFDLVGGWDAGYFMFNEDVDFCHRVHDAGLRVVYEPAIAVYHSIGASKSASPRLIIERHKSMWRYYRKHLRGNVAQDAVTAAGIAARGAAVLGASQFKRIVRGS
jgi:N-acetylglucosaminyl-diphospho-decaprenol L-rhamnosyltransferase